MKLFFASFILNLPSKTSGAFKLLLFLTAFLTGTEDNALHEQKKKAKPKTTQEVKNAETEAFLGCEITDITTSNISTCNNNGTNNIAEDDYFTADVTVTFSEKPTTGMLVLSGRGTASVSVNQIGTSSYVFPDVHMSCAAEANNKIRLLAYFSADPDCSKFKEDAGTAQEYCSPEAPTLCGYTAGAHNDPYPFCWPPEGENLPNCDNSIKYAPDPLHPELTPIKYIRVVVHILQKEDANDRDNFTVADLDVIKSWFDGPEGINHFWANLCPSSDDSSPDIQDSRIRAINTGTIGTDVFFHPDNKGWATTLRNVYACPCGPCCSDPNDCCTDCGPQYLSNLTTLTNRYISGSGGWAPSLSTSEIAALSSSDIRNAYHFFISRGGWRDCNKNGIPDAAGPAGDSYDYWTQGWTDDNSLNCVGNPATTPPPTPVAIFSGAFETYKRLTIPNFQSPVYSQLPTSVSAMGRGFFGELYHIMGVDHIAPLRVHRVHSNGDDGCDDTPWDAPSNVLGCQFEGYPDSVKCTLTQCQLGKIHYFFERLDPAVQRFPVGNGLHEPVGTGQYNMEASCDINMPDIVIYNGEDITWDFSRQLRSNVIVKTGGKLTITCRIGMPNGGKMTVEKGGKLTVDGGEVYNNCPAGWKGFVVEGDPNLVWNAQTQGYLRLMNGALIQGAYMSEVMGGGRIFSTQESTFYNCGNITIYPYSQSSKCWFYNTNFIYDGATATIPIAHLSHVTLAGNRGSIFFNCDFSAKNISQGMLEQTYGITATGAGFSVSNGSTFTGFFNGIFAQNWFLSPLSNFSIGSSCVFSDNKVGINAFGTNNFSIIGNVFKVGGGAYGTDISTKGIVMTNCTGYNVERNTLSGTGNVPTERIGILVDNSLTAANRIKDNTLSFLSRGNQAQLVNSGALSGLQYLCNQNSNNTRDFLSIGSIFSKQGNGNAARNTFTKLFPPDGDFRNEVNTIKYYHSAVGIEIPDHVYGVSKIPAQKNNSCFGDTDNDGTSLDLLTPTEWQEAETKFNDAKSVWQAEAAGLTALLDGGNTPAFLSQVDGATQGNALQVIQQLQANSPYLTKEVLMAAIGKIQVLSSNTVRDVLIANPDELGKSELRTAISNAFQTTTVASILSHYNDATARTAKETKVSENRAKMYYAADRLISHIAQDTPSVNLTLLRTWLSNKQSLEADYAIVSSYVSEGNFTAAYQQLSGIANTYILDAQQSQSHNNLVTLLGIWKNIIDNSIPINGIPTTTLNSIQSIADSEPRMAGAMSRGLLNAFYGYHYEVVALDPSGQLQPLILPDIGNGATNFANGHYITAYPNPARKSVAFNWQLPNGIEEGSIQLMDMQGREVERMAITGQYGSMDWRTDKVDAGFYFYKIRFANGESGMEKLVIIK